MASPAQICLCEQFSTFMKHLSDLQLIANDKLYRYGENFMLESWSFRTEPDMLFSGILPCLKYLRAMRECREGYKTPRSPGSDINTFL